ncbi:MAG: hypothetical protein ABIR81_01475 [Ginsengibacter sp.]
MSEIINYKHSMMEQPVLTPDPQARPALYSIPIQYRRMENFHIVFWILKDISWCIIFKPLGIAMIFPTLIFAIIITWRARQFVSEAAHNIAIILWIVANSYWMISEFFGFDTKIVYGSITYKYLCLIPFISGALCLCWYYIYWKPKNETAEDTM